MSFSEEFPAPSTKADIHATKKPVSLLRMQDERVVKLFAEPPSPIAFPREYEAYGTLIYDVIRTL